jgi:hypothetical protein
MKWPKGKYNGRRIVGARLHIRINLLMWRWVPRAEIHNLYGQYLVIHWLPWYSFVELEYE